MKKIFLSLSLLITLNIQAQTVDSLKKELKPWNLKQQEMVNSDVKLQEIESLKLNKAEIVKILHDMKVLTNEMKGYEERIVMVNLMNFFKSKYLIEDTDMLNIKSNLNQAIKRSKEIKESKKKKEEPIKIFGVQ